jgi:hypothetical protein
MRHDLESGAWAELKPIGGLKGRDRDAYERAIRMMVPRDRDGEIDAPLAIALGLDMRVIRRDAAIACMVTRWSFTAGNGDVLPLPLTGDTGIENRDSIGELPLGDLDEIEELLEPYLVKLRRPDPKAPAAATTTSSNGRSREKASSPPA